MPNIDDTNTPAATEVSDSPPGWPFPSIALGDCEADYAGDGCFVLTRNENGEMHRIGDNPR